MAQIMISGQSLPNKCLQPKSYHLSWLYCSAVLGRSGKDSSGLGFLNPCLRLCRLCLQSHCPWPASFISKPDFSLQTHVCCFVALPLSFLLGLIAFLSTKRTSFLLWAASANNQIGKAGMFQEH